MRKLVILAVLALAACNENAGWNPNYTMNNTPYGAYQRARETALVTDTAAPRVIPVQLPAKAPTPEEISGKSGETKALVTTRVVAVKPSEVKVSPAARAAATAPAATTGSGYAGSTPVLVRFAHAEKHNPGTVVYPRTGANAGAAERSCRGFTSANAAQTAFLAAGGPVIDPRGLDPDGDGFVCGWDPRPFRTDSGL